MFIHTEITSTNANVIMILKSSTSDSVPIQRFTSVHRVQVLASASLDFTSDPFWEENAADQYQVQLVTCWSLNQHLSPRSLNFKLPSSAAHLSVWDPVMCILATSSAVSPSPHSSFFDVRLWFLQVWMRLQSGPQSWDWSKPWFQKLSLSHLASNSLTFKCISQKVESAVHFTCKHKPETGFSAVTLSAA